jgi:hypothetical protein
VSRRRRRNAKDDLIVLYECLGCGRKWREDLKKIAQMRIDGRTHPHHSGTSCPCGHPYIKWLNYDELAPRLNATKKHQT